MIPREMEERRALGAELRTLPASLYCGMMGPEGYPDG